MKDVRSSQGSFEVDTEFRLDLASQNAKMVCIQQMSANICQILSWNINGLQMVK